MTAIKIIITALRKIHFAFTIVPPYSRLLWSPLIMLNNTKAAEPDKGYILFPYQNPRSAITIAVFSFKSPACARREKAALSPCLVFKSRFLFHISSRRFCRKSRNLRSSILFSCIDLSARNLVPAHEYIEHIDYSSILSCKPKDFRFREITKNLPAFP